MVASAALAKTKPLEVLFLVTRAVSTRINRCCIYICFAVGGGRDG